MYKLDKNWLLFTKEHDDIRSYENSPAINNIVVYDGQKHSVRCEICNKICAEIGSLRRHIQAVHDKIKPFGCKFCHKVFPHAATMKRHVRFTHEGQ